LRTTTELPAGEVALAYKQLAAIERIFREAKDVMRLRPIYHHWKRDNVKGHVFACFLALCLAARLRQKLDDAGKKLPWNEIIRDLSQLRAVVVRIGSQRYLLRSPLQGHAGAVLQVVGLKPPPLAQPLS
jgi:transposase